LNLSYFISKRIRRDHGGSFSSTLHKIAVASIAVGLAASIVAFLVMRGFQDTVQNKVFGFSGHVMVTKFSDKDSPEELPLNYHFSFYDKAGDYPLVEHIQEVAHKPGLVKVNDEVLGIVLKGIGKSFDRGTFENSMVEGKFIELPDSGYSNQIVLSKIIASKLNAKVNDDIVVHFFQNPPRFRKLKIVGIYETNLSEYFDSKVIIGDIRIIQRLNDWSDSLAGAVEIFVADPTPARVEEVWTTVGETTDYDYAVQKVSDKFYQVFEWLGLISRQVNALLWIIMFVICLTMISIILILVMERTQMIGTLKALGANNSMIRSVFIYQGVNLIVKGLLWGNLVGLGVCFTQYHFKLFKLNPHDYYMSVVPVSWEWEIVGMLNILMLVVVTVVLLVPTMIITRINPIKAIRFD
jgi:lipoprotein-releasing system permease protein